MNIIIRPFTIDLYDAILALWKKCDGIGLSNADSRENIQAYLERNQGMSFIALNNDRVIGAVLAGHDGRRGYIHHLAVHPNYRRKGLGHQLIDNCLQHLKNEGIQKCHLFIFNDNTNGIEFWKNIGWMHRPDISVISKTID